MADEIQLAEYDARWPIFFEQEAEWLRNILPYDLPLAIEHIGSTAVPELEAKPIIDILIGVRSLDEVRAARRLMEGFGYTFKSDDPDTEHMHFVKGLPPAPARTHHVHFRKQDDVYWDHILFRDHLRSNRDDAAAYAALKRDLAARFASDRVAYTDGKTTFVHQALIKARERAARLAAQWQDDD